MRTNKNGGVIAAFIALLNVICLLFLIGVRVYCYYNYSVGCNQYLERAASANTIELAESNLQVGIKYLDDKKLTNGIVSIFLHQPINDIGYFYSNLTSSMTELQQTKNASQLQKSNILLKLRETLTEKGENGDVVFSPNGISIYPYNRIMCFFFLSSLFFIITVGIVVGNE